MDREVVLRDQTVVVEGQIIKSVGPSRRASIPTGAKRIDGRGKYLMPGLVDMHVHIYAPQEFDLYLANGVTTVYNLNGRPAHLKWRDQIAKGKLDGPTVVTCGPTFFQCATQSEARVGVAAQARQGYDAIKIYTGVSKDAYPVLVDAARANKMLVVGHIPRDPGFEGVIAKSMPVAHAEEFLYTVFDKPTTDEFIDETVARTVKAGIPVTATLVCFENIYQQASDLQALLKKPQTRYLAPWQAEVWLPGRNTYEQRFNTAAAQQTLARNLRFQKDLMLKFHKAGGLVVTGTDANCVGTVAGFGMPEEVQNFGEIGFTPYRAIRAATLDAAIVLKREHEFGIIAAGKRADLLLLDANPLADLGHLGRRSGVMARGRWFSASDLKARLGRVAGSYQKIEKSVRTLLGTKPKEALALLEANDPFGGLSTSVQSKILRDYGIAGFRQVYQKVKADFPSAAIIGEESINELGYYWLNTAKRPASAVDIFLLNVEEHPKSANCWDSLGEGYAANGDKLKAIQSYRKALELDPNLPSAIEALKKLGG